MVKCEYCQTWNKHGVSNCFCCGAPIDYTKESALPMYLIRNAHHIGIDWDTPGGCLNSSSPCNFGGAITVFYPVERMS
jgi:hypothetical protein